MYSSLYGMADNAQEVTEAALANMSPRARELETLERYATGRQYEGLPDWFSDDVPLWERAPCIVYNIAGVAIRSNTHLVLGEGRFPALTSNPGENDAEAGGLDEESSRAVDRALSELMRRARYRSVCRQSLHHGQQAKSVAIIAGVRAGKPFLETVRARWCEPKFDIHRRVTSLEIRYPYVDWHKQPDGKWKLKAKLYRRIIDETSDTTYVPIEADKGGREPLDSEWLPDKDLTVSHKLGFCPVHWYAHMRECSTVADYDGEAIHQEALDEIRGLDFALSQRHRAALFCGDPQIIETGVAPGHNPSGRTGRASGVPSTYAGGSKSAANPVTGMYADQRRPARVKSPGVVWQYEDPQTKVTYLSLPAEALGALDSHASDLRNKIADMLSVVILDPQNVKNTADMSGKAIEQLRARQFDRCDEIRLDVEENLLLPLAKLLLRVALATKVRIRAVDKVRETLRRFVADDDSELMLFLRWPAGYVKPDPSEEQAIVKVAVSAKDGGIATRRMAVEKIATIFGIDNVDQAADAIEKESAAGDAALHASMRALGGGDNGANDGADGDGAPGPIDPSATTPRPASAVTASAPTAAPARSSVATTASTEPAGGKLSQAGVSTSGIAETVHKQLLEDYPPDAVAWVRAAKWQGPILVPLEEIDFSRKSAWQASREPDRVQFFADKIAAGEMKPIVLVNEPNNDKLIVIDGHHRSLAYEELGQSALAYVASVGAVSGPWDLMHNAQRDGEMAMSRQKS